MTSAEIERNSCRVAVGRARDLTDLVNETTSTDPSNGSSVTPLVAGEIETNDRLTFTLVAALALSRSFARTLATAVPPVEGDAQPESFTASTKD